MRRHREVLTDWHRAVLVLAAFVLACGAYVVVQVLW